MVAHNEQRVIAGSHGATSQWYCPTKKVLVSALYQIIMGRGMGISGLDVGERAGVDPCSCHCHDQGAFHPVITVIIWYRLLDMGVVVLSSSAAFPSSPLSSSCRVP